jgi:tetratricopeptide (TPR) repeat protein
MLGRDSEVDHGALALDLAEQKGDFERAADVMNNKGGLAYFAADWGAAVDWYQQAVDASLKAGNQMGAANARANMLELFIGQRRFDEADELLPEVRRAFTALGMDSLMWFVDLQEGRLLSAIGFHRQAIELLEPLVEAWMEEDPFTALQLVLPLTESLTVNGRGDDGLALLAAAEEASGEMAVYLRATIERSRAITDGGVAALNAAIEVAIEEAAVLDELELLEQLANLGAVTPAQERRRHELIGQLGVAT